MKTNYIKNLLLGAATMTCLSSCTHYYYVPNAHNVPLLKEKNEFHATAAIGGGDESTCSEVQAAYAVTDKFAVMANYMSAKGGNTASGKLLEGAIGYFKPIGKYGVFEIYGGFGSSSQHHEYWSTSYNGGDNYLGSSDLSFNRFFLQPAFGLSFNWLDLAVSSRLSSVSFHKVDYVLNPLYPGYAAEDLNRIVQTRNYLFFEPAVTLRAGWKYLKLQLQVSLSDQSILNPGQERISAETMHVCIGLHLALAKRFWKDALKKKD